MNYCIKNSIIKQDFYFYYPESFEKKDIYTYDSEDMILFIFPIT